MSISAELGERKTVKLPQGTVAYRERGDGPPIVFVHGLWVNGDHWRKVVPLLADRFRCIAPDLPLGAHVLPLENGDQSLPGLARLIADLIAALELEDVTVVSNDTGDALAQVLVAEHPERIARVVLTPGDAFTNFLPWVIKPARALGYSPRLLNFFARLWGTGLGRWAILRPIVAHDFPPDDVLNGYSRPAIESAAVRHDLQMFFRNAKPSHTLRAAEQLRETNVPALVVWTKLPSPVFPKAHGRRLAKLIPNARYEEVGGALAFMPEDKPERLAELIGEFATGG